MPTNPKDLSTQQRAAVLALSSTRGMTCREVNTKVGVELNSTTALDTLRNRGIAKAFGHYSPMRCKWILTEAGLELQKLLLGSGN